MLMNKYSSTLFLAALALAASQADMDTSMMTSMNDGSDSNSTEIVPIPHEMKHGHGLPILQTDLTVAERLYWESYNTTTFFNVEAPHKSALWYHVFSMAGCFIFFYPIAVMLNGAKSKWYIPALTLYNLVMISSLISLKVFGSTAPNLYPKNAYSKMSWILLFASLFQYVIAIFYCAAEWFSGEWLTDSELDQPFIPLENLDLERPDSPSPSPSTLIDSDTRNSNEANEIQRQNSPDTYKDSLDLEAGIGGDYHQSDTHAMFKKPSRASLLTRDTLLGKVFQNETVKRIAEKFSTINCIIFNCMNIPMLLYLFVYVSTGAATGSLMAQGGHVFNILAHFIKGGVFVSLGVLSLARYCGCYRQSGLAWNKMIVFKNQVNTSSIWYKWVPHGMITMEGYESFLIFFYGSTNVFLEHLAAEPGVWTAKDLQHASIAFMYIGSGLCGLITEHILSEWRFNQVLSHTKINPGVIHAGTPGYSPNPFPVFTIFWTGILMSQHEQASTTSTLIHMQWGYLLSYGSFFRLLTYVLLMLVPNKNLNPARPFTELITSFCLICGGFIFMQSNDQTVEALEFRGLTGMFTLNVNVGIVALIMAWEMLLLIWKNRLQSTKQI